jgi:hypothetical protein
MTTLRQAEANRNNSSKSTGPRTAAGKLKAGRNAVRHGLAALVNRIPVRTPELDSFAEELCCGNDDPAIFAKSLTVAHNEVVLQAIRRRRMSILEKALTAEGTEDIVADLKRLDRYERRAWAKQKRELRELVFSLAK